MKRRIVVGFAVVVIALIAVGGAAALQALPPGAQVNDDAAAGIDPGAGLGGEEPADADVTAGALTAGARSVPWAIFRQGETAGAHDQAFVRSFAAGSWTTRGFGTMFGRSSATPMFSGSLNFDQGEDAEAPEIDFAGAGRTVPWATWYENTTGALFGANNIFAGRFDNSGDAAQGKWIFAGQGRGLGGGTVQIPSLNLHTNEPAENPSVAGGSTGDPTKPAPWVTWQERDTPSNTDQIFVVRGEGPGLADCTGVTPTGTGAIGGFCWQQVGIPRVGPPTTDPSLNVDPTRDGTEPDIAFTGSGDAVPWVVWYETGTSTIGLHSADGMVFAAKAVSDTGSGNGGFHWVAVGTEAQGELDVTGATNHFGSCAESPTAEAQCSLNVSAGGDGEDPRVAAGTMTPGLATVPWVVWDEADGGARQVFAARLVGSGAAARFVLANDGHPLSSGSNDSARPDITFSGTTPYVTWREDTGMGAQHAFAGHFVNAADPTFVLDSSSTPLPPFSQVDVREPISSSCTANPFNQDGAACQGAAMGTPFFLFTSDSTPRGLFADAYAPDAPVTGSASAITTTSSTVAATVDPHGASAAVSFQYGPTTEYAQATAPQPTGAVDGPTPFSAALTDLPVGATIHYRATVTSDFGTVVGADETLSLTAPPPPPPPPPPPATVGTASVGQATVSGTTATVKATCTGSASATCKLKLELEVTETLRGHKVIAVKARSHKPKTTHKTLIVGSRTVTLGAGHRATEHVALNATGRHLLKLHHTLRCRLLAIETLAGGHHRTVATKTVTFRAPRRTKHHAHR